MYLAARVAEGHAVRHLLTIDTIPSFGLVGPGESDEFRISRNARGELKLRMVILELRRTLLEFYAVSLSSYFELSDDTFELVRLFLPVGTVCVESGSPTQPCTSRDSFIMRTHREPDAELHK